MYKDEINWEIQPYRDKFGRQIECDELELLLRDREYKIVKQETIGQYLISTVWLGVPHGMGTQYFETAVFMPNEEKLGISLECVRYENLSEAEIGARKNGGRMAPKRLVTILKITNNSKFSLCVESKKERRKNRAILVVPPAADNQKMGNFVILDVAPLECKIDLDSIVFEWQGFRIPWHELSKETKQLCIVNFI